MRAAWARSAVPGLMEIIAAGALAGALTWAALTRALPPEDLLSFLTALVLVYQPMKALGRVTQFGVQAGVAGERIFALFDRRHPCLLYTSDAADEL